MGEAKRRKQNDPYYGKPKRGLVISNPIEIERGKVKIRTTFIDPQELRYALLFWDELAWPRSNAIVVAGGADENFLESAGVLSRPEHTFSGMIDEIMVKTQLEGFLQLEKKEPGKWALAQGENSFLLKDKNFLQEGGAFFELMHAIPVPNSDVALQDILEFKAKRAPELLALRAEIDGLSDKIANAENSKTELEHQIATVDAACKDMLKIAKEWPFPFRLTNVKASLDLRPTTTLAAITAPLAAAAVIGWPLALTGALVGGVGASIKIGGDLGMRNLAKRLGPYRYAYQFHKELFCT